MAVKELGRNSSLLGVLKKVLSASKTPMSCEEITAHALELWGRGLPSSPYEDVCVIYKLLKNYLDTEEYFDDLEDNVVMVERIDGICIPLSPELSSDELNEVSEQIKRIKFSLALMD